ncbi:MAG: cyclic nucleotide-binding domain-containing protein [Proteobacteria bacterium]|nr:cyclic nucleotide-binding domain-containing protein [Pseudomonadota bacterium]MBU1417240.1 cyclic nucleotide-binding domain-containing protein [Pseudomonadota bacterium]MBU1455985.1 cyclic nucleotide-binding domain-containing protein [Pseudomonadota bacterium]
MDSSHEQKSAGEPGNQIQVRVQSLFAEIKGAVTAQDFVKAEALRDELLEVDTMALKEIIESAELIEAAKLAGIDQEHLLLWKEFYDRLSPEETSLFYYSLKNTTVPAKTILTRQGKLSDRLFLIEQGRLAAVFRKGKENYLVLQLGKGAFVGEETFFGMAICTSSVITQAEATLKVLEKAATFDWNEKAPGLYAKIEAFCHEYGQYEEAYDRKRQQENHFQRLTVQGQVSVDILSSTGKPTGHHFKAALEDISCSGACFFIKSSRKEGTRALLGRPLKMIFSIKGKTKPVEFVAIGRVVKVKFHLENDYSVHVQFAKTLGQEKIDLLQAR